LSSVGKGLVTGADGFIGSHLVETLVAQGYDVLYNSLGSRGWLDTVPGSALRRLFQERGDFVEVVCPPCGSTTFDHGLEKLDFRYIVCNDCESLYMSPRPPPRRVN
jgi:NAD(P)-dependent dehydrogenase (short-subunit alcohol dehydrogenase family)